MLGSFSCRGDDDCFGGRITLVIQPIAREGLYPRLQTVEERLQPRRLGVGLGGVKPLPVREKRSKLSGPPPLGGETGERSDDERE